MRIVSKKSKAQLKCRLPLRKLAEFSKRTQMDSVDGKGGYKSRIEAERPEIGWFEILILNLFPFETLFPLPWPTI